MFSVFCQVPFGKSLIPFSKCALLTFIVTHRCGQSKGKLNLLTTRKKPWGLKLSNSRPQLVTRVNRQLCTSLVQHLHNRVENTMARNVNMDGCVGKRVGRSGIDYFIGAQSIDDKCVRIYKIIFRLISLLCVRRVSEVTLSVRLRVERPDPREIIQQHHLNQIK